MKKILLLSLIFVAFLESGAIASKNASGVINRKIAVNPAFMPDGYSAVLYDNTGGLPTSEANAIAETGDGFIWIGAYSGLYRYDGHNFVRLSSTTGIASVVSLFVDKRDRLWIGTNDLGIAMIERGQIRRWNHTDGLKSLQINHIAEEENGIIYAASATGLVMINQDFELSYLDDARILDAPIACIRTGIDGLIYGATNGSDIFTIKDGKIVSYLSHNESKLRGIEYILPDPERPGYFYLGMENAVFYGTLENRLKDFNKYNISPLSSVDCLEFTDGSLWICARNGFGVLTDEGVKTFQNFPLNNSICNVMTDYEGNLWFVSDRQGVMKIVPNQFSNLFEHYKLPEAMVNTTCIYGDKLFMGTDTGLIVIDKKGSVPEIKLKSAKTASGIDLGETDLIKMLEGKRIRSIIRDNKNRLWIATWQSKGLLCYYEDEVVVFTDKDGLMSNRIRTAYQREDGSILVVNTGGVSIISGDKVIKNYNKDDGITIFESLSVCEGFAGEILLGSNGGGIYVIDSSGTKNIGLEDGLTSGIIMRIKRDFNKKIYWIITSNSLAYMTDDYKVHTLYNFPYSNNYDLYTNSRGEAWILASNGIYVANVKELLKDNEIHPVYYGISNGMQSVPTGNSYSELSSDGNLYIASRTGVIKVNIEKTFEKVNDLKISVPFIDVDGKRIYPEEDGSFKIKYTAQKLTIHSFVFNYSLSDPKLSYQLEGFENESAPINRSELVPIDYTNLRGGVYNFKIHLMNAMGREDNKIFSVKIYKEYAFYEQTWFYILSAVLLVFILLDIAKAYVDWKTKKLKQQQEEDMMLIREITEAFASLIDIKDEYTNGHSFRVANYTAMLAKELGYSNEITEKYYRIALLHDIGKIGVPDSVLNKHGKLTDEEFELIKSHTTKGYEALKGISVMPELAVGAGFHHERPDGKGYPQHLKDNEIPKVAKIIAVADTFDAMYSTRAYRARMNFDKVVEIIKEAAGTQLDSDVVAAFLRLADAGELRAPDDNGGGSTENITNI